MENDNITDTIRVTMVLTEEWSARLDDILQKAFDNRGIASMDVQDEAEIAIYEAAFEQLEDLRFGKALTDTDFQMYNKAIPFLLTGGFTALYKSQKEEAERKRKLTDYQIKAAKREPYLIAWSVITTLATLILGWLQFSK